MISPRERALTGNVFGIGSMIVWAAGFPAAEILLDRWNPLALITARFIVALALLIPLWVILEGPQALARARWGKGTLVGALAFGMGAYLLLLAQWFTDPVTVAIIAASTPIAGTLLEMVRDKRRLRLPFIIGLVASVVGGVIATGGSAPADLGIGAALAITSCILFTWGSDSAVRDFPDLTPIGRTTITLLGGTVLTALLFLVTRFLGLVDLPPRAFNLPDMGLLAIYAIGGMALSQFLWISAVGRLGVALASFHINIAPFYVMLILLALGGSWSWPQVLGAAVVAAGVVIAQR
jgi:drug/metabolite transporter (DMT)-like permease